MTLKKSKQAMYYDRGAKELEELYLGDLVQIQLQQSQLGMKKDWTLARVEENVDIRSYQVQTKDRRVNIRNRQNLRHACETTPDTRFETVLPPKPKPPTCSSPNPSDKVPMPPATQGTRESHKLQQAALV